MQPKDLSADHHARRCRKTLPERIRPDYANLSRDRRAVVSLKGHGDTVHVERQSA
jgi:hypothetical protein